MIRTAPAHTSPLAFFDAFTASMTPPETEVSEKYRAAQDFINAMWFAKPEDRQRIRDDYAEKLRRITAKYGEGLVEVEILAPRDGWNRAAA
jgi:hypothetical protein